jgi:uncharacterized protein (TIGR03083 family)
VDRGSYLDAIGSGSAALARAADGALEAKIPGCPDWVMADLVSHLGGLYSWVTLILEAEGERPEGERSQPPVGQEDLIAWFNEMRDGMVAALSARSSEDAAWVFVRTAPHNVGWWCRRQALETAVHRFDAEAAVGSPNAIDARLAADGIDEFLTQFMPGRLARQPVEALTGTFHVHATDTEGEWTLDFGAADLAARREHAKADTALRGPASGLYLWIWNRQTPEEAGLEIFGNRSPVDAWPYLKM